MKVVVDSCLTFEEAIRGSIAPLDVLDQQVLLDVKYYSFDGIVHQGQIMVNKKIEKDVIDIFNKILEIKFPINKCIPMSNYNWDDDASMDDNNSSAFCYRLIAGTDKISNHSFGYAIDINPKLNPLITKSGVVIPASGSYDVSKPGTLKEGDMIQNMFIERGFVWGKFFSRYADIHHFEKEFK